MNKYKDCSTSLVIQEMKFKATMRHHFIPISMVVTKKQKLTSVGTSLVIQGLRLHASAVGGVSLIPGRETKIPHAALPKKKKTNKQTKKKTTLFLYSRN